MTARHPPDDLIARGLLCCLAAIIIYNSLLVPTREPDSIAIYTLLADRTLVVLLAVAWAASIVAVTACWTTRWRRIGGQIAIGLCTTNALAGLYAYGLTSPFLRLSVLWMIAALMIAEIAARPAACDHRRPT